MLEEKIVDFKGWEDLYQISNYGYIIAKDKYVHYKNGRKSFYKGKILKPRNSHGYLNLNLHRNNEIKTIKIHQEVAKHFIPKVEGKTFINHIDGNSLNNRADNLEWCTQKENIQHALRTGLVKNESKKKKVIQIDKNTNEIIAEYESVNEAIRQNGWNINNKHGIHRVCNRVGNRETAYGYKWRYVNVTR